MNEQNLIKRIRNRDRSALPVLMEAYQDYIYTIALRMVKNQHLAEEITQDVFIKVYQKIDSFRQSAKLSTWLFTITYRTGLNYLDKKSLLTTDLSPSDEDVPGTAEQEKAYDASGEGINNERRDILWKAIDQLPRLQGIALSLYYLQEFSVAEVAGIMDIPVNSVKTHLFRGRKGLKDILKKNYAAEDLL